MLATVPMLDLPVVQSSRDLSAIKALTLTDLDLSHVG